MTATTGDYSLCHLLINAGGFDLAPERMQWLVLTWDFARIDGDGDLYHRALMGLNGYVRLRGHRGEGHFTGRWDPALGEVEKFAGWDHDSLVEALDDYEMLLSTGFAPVCRPLAVDCSAFGQTGGDLVDLLEGFIRPRQESQLLMRHINHVRSTSMDTHLAPQWEQAFPSHTADQLWAGR